MKAARVRIWARPHASPHLRVAVPQFPAPGRCSEILRGWAASVLSDVDGPPLVIAGVALWPRADGVVTYEVTAWSECAAMPLPMVPDIVRAYLSREITIWQAKGETMRALGYDVSHSGDDPEPTA